MFNGLIALISPVILQINKSVKEMLPLYVNFFVPLLYVKSAADIIANGITNSPLGR